MLQCKARFSYNVALVVEALFSSTVVYVKSALIQHRIMELKIR